MIFILFLTVSTMAILLDMARVIFPNMEDVKTQSRLSRVIDSMPLFDKQHYQTRHA